MAGGDRRNADSAIVAALAAGQSIRDIATSTGVSESTVYRRLRDDDFRQRVAETRAELVSSTLGRLVDAGSAAAQKLRRLLDARSESVQLAACRAILELSVRWRQSEELEARITALESQRTSETQGARP